MWRSHQPFLRSFLAASLGSSCRQCQDSQAENINETVTHFNHRHFNHCHWPPAVSKFQQEHQHEIPRHMAIWCDEVAEKLLENTSLAVHNFEFFKLGCRNKSTCTCSGNSLRYGLLLDVPFHELSAIKKSLEPQYRTGNLASPKGTKWWPSMAPLQIGMCQKLLT